MPDGPASDGTPPEHPRPLEYRPRADEPRVTAVVANVARGLVLLVGGVIAVVVDLGLVIVLGRAGVHGEDGPSAWVLVPLIGTLTLTAWFCFRRAAWYLAKRT